MKKIIKYLLILIAVISTIAITSSNNKDNTLLAASTDTYTVGGGFESSYVYIDLNVNKTPIVSVDDDAYFVNYGINTIDGQYFNSGNATTRTIKTNRRVALVVISSPNVSFVHFNSTTVITGGNILLQLNEGINSYIVYPDNGSKLTLNIYSYPLPSLVATGLTKNNDYVSNDVNIKVYCEGAVVTEELEGKQVNIDFNYTSEGTYHYSYTTTLSSAAAIYIFDITFVIDKTTPTGTLSGTVGNPNYYRSNVTFTWIDALSTEAPITITLD
ncbi:MAG: hypothetical protein LBV51_00785, partial [Acholeplasmatales bacterium]|nr:hypothetical protein [Acholeplasmatales bacterium]